MDSVTRLANLARFYHREAERAERGRAYLSACVAETSALEAALLAMCMCYPREVRATAVYKRKNFRRKRNKALDFNLSQLISIADELAWFPPKLVYWAGKRASLAGFAHEVREIRNHVHAGVCLQRNHEGTLFKKGTFAAVREVSEVATDWLVHTVHQSLRRSLGKEGLL